MYRYSEEEARKTPLTRKLIRKSLSRRIKGLLLLVTIILVLSSFPLLPLTLLFMEDGLSWPLIFPLMFYGAILGIYVFSFVRLWHIRHTELSVRRDTVSAMDVFERPYYMPHETRELTILHFEDGGTFSAARLMARDGIGDEFLVVSYADDPDKVLDIYRATEYEWLPDAE